MLREGQVHGGEAERPGACVRGREVLARLAGGACVDRGPVQPLWGTYGSSILGHGSYGLRMSC
jgi:hypothetical protein